MKKIILSTTATLLLAATGAANASPKQSYLTSGTTGEVITSGTGLCWNTSGDKVYSELCGDPKPVPVAAPQPKVVTPSPVVVAEKKVVEVNIDLNVLFRFDSAVLSKKAQEDLTRFANSYNLKKVSLVGHADAFGSNKYNKTLGQKRADSVKNFLVSVGVNPDIIKPVTSDGKSNPVVVCTKKTISCEAPNRRVTVQASGTEK